jgi:serine/threonine-protein kinase
VSQRFYRCVHCGLPHPIDEPVCAITGRPVEVHRSARAIAANARGPEGAASARGTEAAAHRSPGALPQGTGRPKPAFLAKRPAEPDPLAASVSSLIGQVLGGKYRSLRLLGEGGMGAVYECEHVAIHRRVAVKVLHPAQARKKASVTRFQNEAHVAGAIGHPNICEVYDMGELEDGSPFLVMELLEGETLADRIASEGALPFDDVVDVIGQVLAGLVAAHGKGIIHRDIKPENVFLTARAGRGPMIKLLDFGISKVAGADDLHLTRTGMVMGTPFYMSPEQARGDRNLDHRVDLYATGVMMYECLTGRRPFHAANYNALLMQILTTSPRPAQEVRPAVPDAFEAVVQKAMQRDRDKRYASAAEMQRDVLALRDPVAMRRMPSVPPEPVPLVTPRRDSPSPRVGSRRESPDPRMDVPKPREPQVGTDSASIEIPIDTEAPVSSTDLPAVDERGRLLARLPARETEPRREAPRHGQSARSSPPPRPSNPPPRASNPPPRASNPPPRASNPPPTQRMVSAPPPAGRTIEGPFRAPTPTVLQERPPFEGDDGVDPDPTEVGSIFSIFRQGLDQPASSDTTEQVALDRLAESERDDDDAPTTLFDRKVALKGRALGRRSTPSGQRSSAIGSGNGRPNDRTERPTPSGARARGPKDR